RVPVRLAAAHPQRQDSRSLKSPLHGRRHTARRHDARRRAGRRRLIASSAQSQPASLAIRTASRRRRDPVMSEKVYYLTIDELQAQFRASVISRAEVVDACLARIDALNPRLNAFATISSASARELAKQAEAEIRSGSARGPLDGIPVGVKDFF